MFFGIDKVPHKLDKPEDPVVEGPLRDIVAGPKADVSVEAVNLTLKRAGEGELKGIIEYKDHEILSGDIIGNTHSGIIDAPSTRVIMDRVTKVLVWYENEFGYA